MTVHLPTHVKTMESALTRSMATPVSVVLDTRVLTVQLILMSVCHSLACMGGHAPT